MAALEGYINDTSSALFSLGAAIAGLASDEIEHLARHAGLAQGMAQVIAALPLDAARRQLFVPLQLLESHGSGMEEVFAGKQTPKAARGAGSVDRRGARASEDGAWRCWRTCRRRCGRCSCRWRWSAAISSGCRARTPTPFVPHATSRLRTLWTLWRASRSRAFGALECTLSATSNDAARRSIGEFRSAASKLNRSRKFLRASRMSFRNARSASLFIIGSIRSSWFIATSCRISVRGFPLRVARQGLHHLDMLRRFWALRRREFVAQLRFQRGLVGLDEGIEPDAGAAVGEGDDGGIADGGILPDQVDQHRRVIDQPPAAAFAVGEIEQAAGDGAVDLLAGREPEAGDQRFARQNLALLRRQRLRRVAALVLQQMPQILIGGDAEQPAAAS